MRLSMMVALMAAGLLVLGCTKTDTPVEPDPRLQAPATQPVKVYTADDVLAGDTTKKPVVATAKSPTPPAGSTHEYIVKKGDTLFSIARQELGGDARAKDIKTLNPGLDYNQLKVGQKVVLPAK